MTMITISVATQKGGAGKSTHCGAFASYLNYGLHRQVALIDADYPQHNLKKYRQEEISKLEKNQELARRFEAQGIPGYPILDCKIEEVGPKLEALKKKGKEFVFMDVPGTVRVPGVMSRIRQTDFVFVPLEQEEKSLKSSMEFINYLVNDKEKNQAFVGAFWNRIKASESDLIMRGINSMLDEMGIYYFQTTVEDKVFYKRNEHCTSLFPPAQSRATVLYDEMLEKINEVVTITQ